VARKAKNAEPMPLEVAYEHTGIYGGNEVGFNCKHNLPMKDHAQMVYDIVNLLFPGGQYAPMLKTYAVRFCTLKYFTDLEIDQETDAEVLWNNLCTTTIYDMLIELLGTELQNILMEVEELIDYKKRLIIDTAVAEITMNRATEKTDAIYDMILNIGDKIMLILDNLKDINISPEQAASFVETANHLKGLDIKDIAKEILKQRTKDSE